MKIHRDRGEALAQERKSQGVRHYLSIQGKRVSLQETCYREGDFCRSPRGPIITFSPRARGRMLRRIAEIDWKSAGSVLFVTLTFPPERENHSPEQRSRYRYLFNRFIEKHLGRQVGSVWRVEWKVRQSGETSGQIAPHLHLLYFGVRYLSVKYCRKIWSDILDYRKFIQCEVKRCDTEKSVAIYLAKYCSKPSDPLLLDNVPKHNRTGRHAGWLRLSRIPFFPERISQIRSEALLDFLRRRAVELLPNYDRRYPGGFTLLGDLAEELIADLPDFILDRCPEEV